MDELQGLLRNLVDCQTELIAAQNAKEFAQLGYHREGVAEATKKCEDAERGVYESWRAITVLFEQGRSREERLSRWWANSAQMVMEISYGINKWSEK